MNDHTETVTTSHLRSWLTCFKWAGWALLVFLIACFAYGWFNNFTFWHAYADAGRNSAIAHAIYYGVFAGPVLFAAVTLMARFLIKK